MSFDLDIPDLPEEEVLSSEGEKDNSGGALSFGVIGAGQCGGRIAQAFQSLGIGKAISLNTTDQDHDEVKHRLVLQEASSPGGAGKDPEIARKAIRQNIAPVYHQVNEVFGNDVWSIIICAGLGGGTGTGSVIDLVGVATKHLSKIGVQDPGKRITVIATLPDDSEKLSPVISKNANETARQLSKMASEGKISPLLYIDNGRLKKRLSGLPITQVYPKANQIVAQLWSVFNQIANTPSSIHTFDRTDYTKVLEAGGHTLVGSTVLKTLDEPGVSESLKKNFANPLLSAGYNLSTAKAAAVIVNAPTKVLDTVVGLNSALEHGFSTVASICGDATVFRGIYADDNAKDVKVYTLVTGLDAPEDFR